MLVPSGGFSALDAPGKDFWLPEANMVLIDELQLGFVQSPEHQLRILPHHINSPEFSKALVDALKEVLHLPAVTIKKETP